MVEFFFQELGKQERLGEKKTNPKTTHSPPQKKMIDFSLDILFISIY